MIIDYCSRTLTKLYYADHGHVDRGYFAGEWNDLIEDAVDARAQKLSSIAWLSLKLPRHIFLNLFSNLQQDPSVFGGSRRCSALINHQ